MTLAQIDPGFFSVIGRGVGAILLYAVLGVLLLLLGFWAVDITTPGPLNKMVRQGLPNAVIITAAGMISTAFIVVVAIYSASGALLEGLLAALIFGVVGIIGQVVGARLVEWVAGIDVGGVLTAEKVHPAAFVVSAVHVALGLVVAVAIA
ncbi:DUF350 domain-containing protein [Pseudonocardia sp. GCM10023141]|uniref:DUF350 domain-containing protein n=1 Tax=Pseudonocardia sp. GCM10023141 TaxID=3252653 RepID=UPI00361839C5